jgi:hypothetical protein
MEKLTGRDPANFDRPTFKPRIAIGHVRPAKRDEKRPSERLHRGAAGNFAD